MAEDKTSPRSRWKKNQKTIFCTLRRVFHPAQIVRKMRSDRGGCATGTQIVQLSRSRSFLHWQTWVQCRIDCVRLYTIPFRRMTVCQAIHYVAHRHSFDRLRYFADLQGTRVDGIKPRLVWSTTWKAKTEKNTNVYLYYVPVLTMISIKKNESI